MNSTSKENTDERGVTEKTEPDKRKAPSVETSRLDDSISSISCTSSIKSLNLSSSSMSPLKLSESTSSKSIDNSASRSTDSIITIVEDLPLDSKPLTDSVYDKRALNLSDVVLVEESDKSTDESKTTDISGKKILEISTNSDVHIVESPDKDTTDTKSLNDSVQIISTSDADVSALNDSDLAKPLATNSFKKIVAEDSGKFISPVFSKLKSSNFDSQPAYSTPNELKSKLESGASLSQMGDSTESISMLPPIYKKMGFYVELSAAVYMNKELWTGEMTNITFDIVGTESIAPRLSDSSANAADVSKSVSPSSSSSVVQYALKPSRFSMASMSSSSSGLSSASTLGRKLNSNRLLNRSKRDEVKLTDSYMSGLYEKWINSSEMCNRFLSFIDKNILNSDSINDDSLKFKLPGEESIVEKKEIKEPLPKIVEVKTPVSINKVRQTRGKRQAKAKCTGGTEEDSSEFAVPKKRQRRLETTDVKIPFLSKFSVGDSVFAKWGDRKFYAASLGEMTTEGKWQVNFFDGDKKFLLEEFLIKAEDYTTMVGSNVYASQGDDNFTPGIITDFEVKDGVLHYIVVRDTGDISVPCQFIYINESQARQIRAKTAAIKKAPAKTNDNLIMSIEKRSTRSKTKKLFDSPKPSVSGTQTSTVHLSDTDDDANDEKNQLNLEDVAGVEPESHGVYENGIKLKGKTLTGKNKSSRTNKVNDIDASVLGPVPAEGSKYFKNLHFLLTCTRPQSPKFQILDSENSENTTSENENYCFSTIPFVKDRLKLQLQMGGAHVYNNFDDISEKHWRNTYLISNRPNISARYIQCLAAGIKILCHEWVIRCCSERKKLPLQELPLGWSLERERYFNCGDRKSTNSLKKIYLLISDTGDKSFMKFWSKICKLADINVGKLTRDSNLEQITAIVSESGYKDDNLERAMSHNIPIVTTTWLIQSLLHGEPRKFDGHKSYQTEFIDSD